MPFADSLSDFEDIASDLDAALRLQDILLQAAEGGRGSELDSEYREIRRALLADPSYRERIPKFVRRYRDLGSMWPAFKSFSGQWEPRRQEVRAQFESLLTEAEKLELFGNLAESAPPPESSDGTNYDSSAWTGANTPTERVTAVRTLIPVAQAALEQLIKTLETPGHNGGPALDETEEAIGHLRKLHLALGKLLEAVEGGQPFDSFDGLVSEAARYAKKAARALRDDPLPYAFSGAILAVLSACGFPGIGGFLSGVAASIRKKSA